MFTIPHRTHFRSFFSDHAQYHDSDLSGSEDDTDDASSLKSILYEDDYAFEDTDKDISPEKLTIDRYEVKTDGYAGYGFKDDLVFERANKADVVGGEDGAFADDDDANVDAFVDVNENAPVDKKASTSMPKKEKMPTENKKKPCRRQQRQKKRAAPNKAASAATKRSRK